MATKAHLSCSNLLLKLLNFWRYKLHFKKQKFTYCYNLTNTPTWIFSSLRNLLPFIWVNVIVLHPKQPGVTLKHAKEGTESSAFWSAVGGKQGYTSKKPAQDIVRDPHLFGYSFNKGNSNCKFSKSLICLIKKLTLCLFICMVVLQESLRWVI